jgi:hypothetical protein
MGRAGERPRSMVDLFFFFAGLVVDVLGVFFVRDRRR